MARDANGILSIKWANAGDTGEPIGFDRNEGWPLSYSQPGGLFPTRELFNLAFLELYTLGVDLNQNGAGLEYSNLINYVAKAIVRGSDGDYYIAVSANGPATSVKDPVGDTTGVWIHYFLNTSGNKNFIINGNAIINQRVTAHTLVKDAYGIQSDRFYGMATGTTVDAGSLTRTTATALLGRTGYAFHFAGVTITGTGIIYFRYRMEAKDAVKFKNQKGSFSCKVYQDTGGAIDYTVFVRKADSADNFAAVTAIANSGAQSIADSTESDLKFEDISMGDCSNGIEIEIRVECGAITTKNFYFTELQKEINSFSTVFEHRKTEQELSLCQRYFCKTYKADVAPGTAVTDGIIGFLVNNVASADYTVEYPVSFPTPMRTAPSIILYSPTSGTSGKIAMAAGDVAGTAALQSEHRFRCSGTNGAVATSRLIRIHYTAESEL